MLSTRNQGRRLFGNENATRHSPSIDSEYWEAQMALARAAARPVDQAAAAGAAAMPASQQPGSGAFPYPDLFIVNFANAQAAELWIPVAGYAVSFWDSTNQTDLVNLRFALSQGDVSGKPLPFRPGHALGLGDFSWLGLTWAQIAGATGTLAILPRGAMLDENR